MRFRPFQSYGGSKGGQCQKNSAFLLLVQIWKFFFHWNPYDNSCDNIPNRFWISPKFLSYSGLKGPKTSLFSSPGPKVHVSYCHHIASVVVVVVCRLSSSLAFFKNLLLWNYWADFNQTSHNCFLGYWLQSYRLKIKKMSKNMAAVAKNRPWGSNRSFSHITRKRKQLSKFWEI